MRDGEKVIIRINLALALGLALLVALAYLWS